MKAARIHEFGSPDVTTIDDEAAEVGDDLEEAYVRRTAFATTSRSCASWRGR